jgi:peptide subunit release factor 1 (eRF1)
MITYEDIRELQQYQPKSDSGVLSLYVDVDQSRASNLNRGFETAVEDQCRRIAEQEAMSDNGKLNKFESERSRVMRFLRDYTPKGKGLVIFCDSARQFWWHRDLQVGVPTEARWSSQPWVRPLLELIEDTDRMAVVLIDKQCGRVLSFDATGITQYSEILSEVPNRHVATPRDHIWSQAQMERDHVKHIKWHAKRVTDDLSAIIDRLKLTRLVIGGPVEATSIFIEDLPKRLRQMIIGTVSVPVDIVIDRLAREVQDISTRAELEDELKIVESLITAASKGDRAVLGLPETLEAVNEGRVYRLVVNKNFRAQGKQCPLCGVLIPVEAATKCFFCDSALEPAPDLINRASHKVIEQAGKVQLVSVAAAEKLAAVGSVGAVLRF